MRTIAESKAVLDKAKSDGIIKYWGCEWFDSFCFYVCRVDVPIKGMVSVGIENLKSSSMDAAADYVLSLYPK